MYRLADHRAPERVRPDCEARWVAAGLGAGRERTAKCHPAQELPPGTPLPFMPEFCALQGLHQSTLQHAFSVLDWKVCSWSGRGNAVVAGDPPDQGQPGRQPWRLGPATITSCLGVSRTSAGR
jgi:hypothetical protein